MASPFSVTAAATSSPHACVRHAEGDRLGHLGMREQHLVDLARRDLLAAAIDHLLQASGQREIAVLVEDALIAGPEPAIDE